MMVMPYRARIVLAVLWLTAIACVVSSGFSVDGYKLHVSGIPLPHPYPLAGVVATSLALTLEFGTIFALIRPATYAQSWGRALCATVFAAVAFLTSALSLHRPPYLAVHSLVVLGLTVGLAVLFLATVVAAVRHRAARSQT
jgi:hypothetical protein